MKNSLRYATLGLLAVIAITLAVAGCGRSNPMDEAKLARSVRQFSRAIEIYKKLLQQEPDNNEVRLELARTYEDNRQYDEADGTYREILQREPQRKETLAYLAGVAILRAANTKAEGGATEAVEQYWQEARRRLDEAQQSGAPPAVVLRFRGLYHVRRGETERAIEQYEAATASDPAYVPAREELIGLYLSPEKKDFAKASQHAETILQNDPTNKVAGLALARIYRLQNQGNRALQMLLGLVKAHDNDWEVHQELALTYLLLRDMPNALSAAKRTHAIQPGAVMAEYVKGAAYLEQGNNALAANHFEKVARIESVPDLAADANAKLALCRINQNLFESASQAAQRAIELQPTNTEARFYLAQIYSRKNLPNEAIAQLETLLAIDPHNFQALDMLLRILMDKGDLDYARQVHARVKELGGGFADIRALTRDAMLALLSGDNATAEQVAARAVREFPNDMAAIRAYGQALQANGKYEEAIVQFRKLRELEPPDSTEASVLIASVYTDAGQLDRAIEELQNATQRNPDSVRPYQALATLYENKGQLDQAARSLEKCRDLLPDVPGTYELARLYLMQNRASEAIALWREAQDKFPKEPRFPTDLAVAYLVEKQLTDAEAAAREAIRRSEEANQQQALIANSLLLALVQVAQQNWDGASQTIRSMPIPADRRDDLLNLVDFTQHHPTAAPQAIRHIAMAQLFLNSRRMESAITEYLQAQELVVDASMAPLSMAADIYLTGGQTEKAAEILRQITARKADAASAWSNLAALHLRERRFEEAADAARKALAVSADSVTAHLVLANTSLISGSFQLAINHADTVLAARPSSFEQAQAWEVKGRAYLMLGDSAKADSAFQQSLILNPGGSQALLSRARMLVSARKYSEAETLADEAIRSDPCNADALVVRAIARFGNRRVDDAIRDFRTAIECEPDSIASYVHFAKVLEGVRNFRGAEKVYRQAIQQNPDAYAPRFWLGQLLQRQDRLQEALAELQAVHEIVTRRNLDPTRVPEALRATTEQARIYYQLGEHQKAIELALKLVESVPDQLELRLFAAGFLKLTNDYGRAIEQLEAVLQANPKYPLAYELAAFYFYREQYGDAVRVLEQWKQQFPDAAPAPRSRYLTCLAIAQQFAGDLEKASATTQDAIAATSGNMAPHLARANLLLQQGEVARAQDSVAQIEVKPGAADDALMKDAIIEYVKTAGASDRHIEHSRNCNRALYFSLLGWLDPAAELFDRLATELSDNLFLVHQSALLHTQLRDNADAPALAIARYEQCVRLQPRFRTAYLQLVTLATNAKDDAAALRYIDQGLAAFPDEPSFLTLKASRLEALERYDEAIETYRKIIASPQGVENWAAQNNLAWLLADEKNDLRAALEHAERARVFARDEAAGAVYDTRGWINLQLGNLDEALRDLRLATERSPDQPEVRFHYANALERKGNFAEAAFQLEMALEIDPEFRHAKDAEQMLKDIRSRIVPTQRDRPAEGYLGLSE